MGGDRAKKRQRHDSGEQPSNAAAAAAAAAAESGAAADPARSSTSGRRLFRRATRKRSGANSDESVLSADAAAKMAERKAQRENLRALRERKLSEVETATSSPKPVAAHRSSPRAQKPMAAAALEDARSTPLLLILRGPAAAGKSTIAQAVVDTLRRAGRSVCLLEQDYLRNIALGSGSNSALASAKMLKGCADAALECGYDVVLEGILNSDPTNGGAYRPLLAGLVARRDEPADSAFRAKVGLFYLDVPLKTTKLRHSKRAKAAEFGTEKLDKWWKSSQKSSLAGEVTLKAAKGGGEAGVVGCVAEVLSHVGLDPNGLPL